jgi:hypothetical protein
MAAQSSLIAQKGGSEPLIRIDTIIAMLREASRKFE